MQDYFEKEKDNMLHLLERIVNIDSGSYQKAGVDKVGDILINEFAQLGFIADVHEIPDKGNNIVLKHEEATNPSILLIGHIDTVFPAGTVAKRPFTVEGDFAKGPGVFDMKASHVMTLYALKYLISQNNDAYKNVLIIINTDEEIGSISSRELIVATAKKVQYVFIMEPADLAGNVVTGRKGGGKFFVKIYGKSAHAGVAPEKGASAIQELALKIVALHELTKKEGIHVNVGLVSGGQSVNTIAPFAEAGIDLRFETQEQGEFAQAKILEICSFTETPNTRIEISGGITRPAWKTDERQNELLSFMRDAASEWNIDLGSTYSGGGSDGNFTGNMGIPTIDGLGPRGGNAHQDDEFMVISSLNERGQLLVKVLDKINKRN
ncbi:MULTISPECIES: M20 family metallopeptidase [Bacillaceae]|uniref:M20 family metallopeptidase n=1 Tax=Niallia hominis TaxID=3133173 RepID=A0ABV1F3Y8_9BACI|nr:MULTISPECIES: M20 family metallopeptidase [Bacillaceae]MCF2647830.1 M20 family metallopeptidase [Niallia circulans]MCM3362281.1 M20 family metallopeptidase [Niallia sp. MER TA 168]CAI9388261.1 Carboxypeptidase G2 [Bacillus sp. T2.9-1]